MKKYTSQVTVYKGGKPKSRSRVALLFSWGMMGSGWSKDAYTDSSGVAYVEHDSQGKAQIYVDGEFNSHRTEGNFPGKATVYLS